jgi:hypothetical protein
MGAIIDADPATTAGSVDSTPRIHPTATLYDNMSFTSVAGSVVELAGMLCDLS